MTTRRRTIVLSVQDDFSRQLREFARQMDAAGDATTQFTQQAGAGGGLGQMAFNLNQIFGAAQQVFGVFEQILSTAQEWASIGVGAQRSAMALTALAGSAQEAERWITAIQDATRDTVTEGEAAASAYQLMRFGLADTAEAAGDFVADMSIIAAINPQLGSTAEAINQIQLTMSNMSFLRLDQLGISAGQVRGRIKELQASTKDLSREQAFNIAVMEEISVQTDLVGDGVLKLTSSQDKLNKKLREFKEDIGADVNTRLENMASNVLGLFERIDQLAFLVDNIGVLSLTVELIKIGFGEEFIEDIKELTNLGLGGTGTDFAQQLEVDSLFRELEEQRFIGAATENVQAFASGIDDLSDSLLGLNPGNLFAILNSFGGLAKTNLGNTATGLNFDAFEESRPSVFSGFGEDRRSVQFRQDDPGMMGRNPAGVNPRGDPMRAQLLLRLQQLEAFAQQVVAAGTPGFGELADVSLVGGANRPQQEALDRAQAGRQQQGAFDMMDELAGGVGAADAMTDALRRMDDAAADTAVTFSTLNEKFGIDPDSFDVDVFDRMRESLGAVEVEADLAGDAMLAYQLATGITTASSEVFDSKLQDLARDLAENKIGIEEYVLAVQELGQADLSGIDQAFSTIQDVSGLDAASEFLELAKESPESFENVSGIIEGMVSDLSSAIDVFAPEEGTGLTALRAPVADAEALLASLEASGATMLTVATAAQEQMPLAAVAINAPALVAAAWRADMDALSSTNYVVNATMEIVSTGDSATPPGEGFADGGFTGNGPRNETAGVVHRGEFVVPSQGALVVRGGGEGDGEIAVTVPVFIDGEKVAEAMERVANRRGETTRTPRWIAGQRT